MNSNENRVVETAQSLKSSSTGDGWRPRLRIGPLRFPPFSSSFHPKFLLCAHHSFHLLPPLSLAQLAGPVFPSFLWQPRRQQQRQKKKGPRQLADEYGGKRRLAEWMRRRKGPPQQKRRGWTLTLFGWDGPDQRAIACPVCPNNFGPSIGEITWAAKS